MHNRGIVFRVIGAALAVIALGGCSGLGSNSSGTVLGADAGTTIAREALTPSAIVAVGECWELTYAGFLEQSSTPGGSIVPGSDVHQSYLFAVDSLDSSLQRIDAQNPALLACQRSYDDLFAHAGEEGRILISELLPSDGQWQSGDRSTGCTVQMTVTGSSFRKPSLADLPPFSTFVQSANSSVLKYTMCGNDPGTTRFSGPNLGSAATIAECTPGQPGQCVLGPGRNFPDPMGADYPTDAARETFMHAQCGALYNTATRRGWVFYPSQQQWNDGSQDFECWTGNR